MRKQTPIDRGTRNKSPTALTSTTRPGARADPLMASSGSARTDVLSPAEEQALLRLQLRLRSRRARLAIPRLSTARAYADSFLPQAQGRMYRTIGLTEPCRRWQDGAPISLDVFDGMGVNIGLYMRLVEWCLPLFAVLSLIALMPILYNLLGDEVAENKTLSSHTLGNSRDLSPLHGVADAVCVVLLALSLVWAARKLRAASEKLEPRRPNQLSSAQFTLIVHGLPADISASAQDGLRELFAGWGEVVAVAVSRDNRELVRTIRLRQRTSLKIEWHEAAATRARRSGKAEPGAPTKLTRRVNELNTQVAAMRGRSAPCTGVCFVTFNEQRAAHACLQVRRTTFLVFTLLLAACDLPSACV